MAESSPDPDESVVGEDFDDYRKEFEERLDERGRAVYDAFSSGYEMANAFITRRLQLHLTQHQVARRAGVTQSDISRLEGAFANLSQRRLARIAAVLDADIVLVPRRSARSTTRVPSDTLTTTDAAALLGVSRQFIGRLITSGALETVEIPDSRRRHVPRAAVLAYRRQRQRRLKRIDAAARAMDAAGVPWKPPIRKRSAKRARGRTERLDAMTAESQQFVGGYR